MADKMAQIEKPVPIRERQTQLTRTAILESLAEIIVEEGPLGFTVQNVADRAGVSHRTVYRHFPNREAMCEGLAEHIEERWDGKSHEQIPSTLDAFMEAMPSAFTQFGTDRMLFQSLVLLNLSTGTRSSPARDRDKRIQELVQVLAPSISEAEQRDAVTLIRYLGSSLTWMNLTSQFGRSDSEAAEIAVYGIGLVVQDLKRLERKAKKYA